jgi:hypothetical protein
MDLAQLAERFAAQTVQTALGRTAFRRAGRAALCWCCCTA